MRNSAEEIADERIVNAGGTATVATAMPKKDHIPTLIDRFMRENVSIDPHSEIMYGSGQVYVSCPRRFATVGLEIIAGYGLQLLVDRLRKDLGFKPLEPIDDEDYDEDCDQEGEYYFYAGLNDYTDSKVDNCISVIIESDEAPDNEELYTIDLSEEEQRALYRRLGEESRILFGKSCEDLLEEARQEMEKMERMERMKKKEKKEKKEE